VPTQSCIWQQLQWLGSRMPCLAFGQRARTQTWLYHLCLTLPAPTQSYLQNRLKWGARRVAAPSLAIASRLTCLPTLLRDSCLLFTSCNSSLPFSFSFSSCSFSPVDHAAQYWRTDGDPYSAFRGDSFACSAVISCLASLCAQHRRIVVSTMAPEVAGAVAALPLPARASLVSFLSRGSSHAFYSVVRLVDAVACNQTPRLVVAVTVAGHVDDVGAGLGVDVFRNSVTLLWVGHRDRGLLVWMRAGKDCANYFCSEPLWFTRTSVASADSFLVFLLPAERSAVESYVWNRRDFFIFMAAAALPTMAAAALPLMEGEDVCGHSFKGGPLTHTRTCVTGAARLRPHHVDVDSLKRALTRLFRCEGAYGSPKNMNVPTLTDPYEKNYPNEGVATLSRVRAAIDDVVA
jgi:hypothetical protein